MFPTIAQLTTILVALKRQNCRATDLPKDEPWLDVRLQVRDNGWDVNYGDASYDQDHRGWWGAGAIGPRTNCRDLASDLIEEARDAKGEYEAVGV